ncbi:tetratricopeptide repeat protein [Natranaerobius thermophilus]|uniref:Tetratricopeptide TPR_2 repeat protein n=1 Tax=Natranaerobius thermophilus (strain ATCC BAA-1301 / DSM 18059 / JW/NM-WN-LF) TaxID=457570 RepID=B2A4J8_NATTJ|nr:tetratricopeptide repeat protein [Natranaerobius thermophilus]ACB85175.1 Tetratricopeptide TPR_2 repeat protein [Natranaerobius thermophilus JW/NM-WN-LF]
MFEFEHEFEKIFDELSKIEEHIEQDPEKKDDNDITERLLKLRREIDKCIGYWLQFEEKLWYLQDEYGIDIPDQLDDSLISAYLGISNEEVSNLELLNSFSKSTEEYDEELVDKLSSMKEAYRNKDHEKNHSNEVNSEQNKDNKSIHSFRKGLGYFNLAMLEEAKNEFEQVVSEEPNMIMGHYFLGLAYFYKSEYDKALKKFRLVVELVEDEEILALAYNAIGNIYVDKEEQEKALTNYLRACDYTESFPDIYFNCGAIYFNLGDFLQSVKYFQKALQITSNNSDWELHLYIGKAYTYLGDLDKALKHLKKALRIEPKNEEIHFELGLIYQLKQEQYLAAKEYERAKQLSQKKSEQ